MSAGLMSNVGTGGQVDREGHVTGTGGKGVIAGQEGMTEVTRTGDKVRGHLVDRKGMALHGFEDVGTWLEEGAEEQNVTDQGLAKAKRNISQITVTSVSGEDTFMAGSNLGWKTREDKKRQSDLKQDLK